MDKQLEQRIRDRAYELWMQNGCLPNRADEYWYQAEREILGSAEAQSASDVGGETASDVGFAPLMSDDQETAASESSAPVEISSAPLGMTSETTDEVVPERDGALAPPAPKTRRRRSAASTTTAEGEGGFATGETAKRRRRARTTEEM